MQNEFVQITDLRSSLPHATQILVVDTDENIVIYDCYGDESGEEETLFGYEDSDSLPMANEASIDAAVEFARAEYDSNLDLVASYQPNYGWSDIIDDSGRVRNYFNIAIVYVG